MTAHFEGTAERGDSLILIQGDFRLLGVALSPFTAGPGHLADFSFQIREVLGGSFPTHISEISANANGWDIYRDYDSAIPEVREQSFYGKFIDALEIFKRYETAESYSFMAAEHDVIYSGPDPELVSEADLKRLYELGWNENRGSGNFYHFV